VAGKTECEVCAVLQQPGVRLFETDLWVVDLARDQGYLGRSFVTLKRHCGNLADLTPDEWLELHVAIRRFEAAVRHALGAELFNWSCLMNNAYQHPQPKPHVHWHARPRYRQAVEVANHKFVDPQFGFHYDNNQVLPVDPSVQTAIAGKITAALSD
jgi:diadenosine tetraphosphate (Ap4A) HIT family hydrolase